MTFKAWLFTRRAFDNPRGDFLRDLRTDKTFPAGDTWAQVDGYLWGRGACQEARDEGYKLWKEFRRAHRRGELYNRMVDKGEL